MKPNREVIKKIIRTVMTVEKPHIRIGKRGIHDKLVLHIRNILQSRGIIKIRILKNIAENKEDVIRISNKLKEKLGDFAKIGEIRGRSVVIYAPSILRRKLNKENDFQKIIRT